jgi:SAM-dependent methyltransferase
MESVLVSTHTKSTYSGVMECAPEGLHPFTFELFKKNLPSGAEILDLGSGEGAFAKRLSDAGYDVTACDIEPRSGRPFPYVSVDLNSEFSKAFRGRTYDAISFVEVIEHLENPRLCLREIAKLIKRNGVVLVSTPNASGLVFSSAILLYWADGDVHGCCLQSRPRPHHATNGMAIGKSISRNRIYSPRTQVPRRSVFAAEVLGRSGESFRLDRLPSLHVWGRRRSKHRLHPEKELVFSSMCQSR